jgi:hypothetical protein
MLYWQKFIIAALLPPCVWFDAVLISESFDFEFELLWTIIPSNGRFRSICDSSAEVITPVPARSKRSNIT